MAKSKMMEEYITLTGSNLKGDIPYAQNVRILYGIYCLDKIISKSQKALPELVYPALAKELLRIYDTCLDYFINQEDYSQISLLKLAEALVKYIDENKVEYKYIAQASSYDLAKDVVEHLGE